MNQQQSGLETVGSPRGVTGLGEDSLVPWPAVGLDCEVSKQPAKRAVAGTRIRQLRSRSAIHAIPSARLLFLRRRGQVVRHSGTNEGLNGRDVNLVTFAEVDCAGRLGIEAGVEQPLRVF